MKTLALVPLAALFLLMIASAQERVSPRLHASVGWDHRAGLSFDLDAAVEISFGAGFRSATGLSD